MINNASNKMAPITCIGIFLLVWILTCVDAFPYQCIEKTWESGIFTNETALNLTVISTSPEHFTISWIFIDQSKLVNVKNYVVVYQLATSAERTLITIRKFFNAFAITLNCDGKSQYLVQVLADLVDGTSLCSNSLTVNLMSADCMQYGQGTGPEWVIVIFVMLLWLLVIMCFLRTWKKKMTLRPTYECYNERNIGNPCSDMPPRQSHSYTSIQTRRSHSIPHDTPVYTPGPSGSQTILGAQVSKSSHSFHDLHTIQSEEESREQTSSSSFA